MSEGRSDKVERFIGELRAFCKERGFSISHESFTGEFIIEPWDEDADDWLADAIDWEIEKAKRLARYTAEEGPEAKGPSQW